MNATVHPSFTAAVWHIVDLVLVCTGKARDGDGKPLIDYGA